MKAINALAFVELALLHDYFTVEDLRQAYYNSSVSETAIDKTANVTNNYRLDFLIPHSVPFLGYFLLVLSWSTAIKL